ERPLHWAAWSGHRHVVERLLAAGAVVEAQDKKCRVAPVLEGVDGVSGCFRQGGEASGRGSIGSSLGKIRYAEGHRQCR
ncbi:Ankyrin repeat domain-containing protein 23 (Diabetes-related ankyrin repeat protein), partial [Durusdinium trenchii]